MALSSLLHPKFVPLQHMDLHPDRFYLIQQPFLCSHSRFPLPGLPITTDIIIFVFLLSVHALEKILATIHAWLADINKFICLVLFIKAVCNY